MTLSLSPTTEKEASRGASFSVVSAWRCYPGGASHVATILGADAALDELTKPLGYSGVSAGALVAIARAFDVDHERLLGAITRLLQHNRVLDFSPLAVSGAGLCEWRVVPAAIDDLIGVGKRLGDARLPLVVVVTDLDSGAPVYLDSRNPKHKGLLVSEIARATSAIPGIAPQVPIPSWRAGLYTPGVQLFTDGGVTDNAADHVFDGEIAPRIALRLVDNALLTRVRKFSPVTQALAVFRAMLFASSSLKSRRDDGLVVDVTCIGSGFDFSLSPAAIRERAVSGGAAVRDRAASVLALKGRNP